MKTATSLSWLVAVAGLWALVSPFSLGYSAITMAMWNAVIVGAVLIILAAGAALSRDAGIDRNLDWINAVLGLWLVVSPFILGYSATMAALWNTIIVGLMVIVLAVWATFTFGQSVAPQS